MVMSSLAMIEGVSTHISKPSSSSASATPAYHHHQFHHHHSPSTPSSSPAASTSAQRIHTLDLKAKLATALGLQGKRYWDTLLRFCTAKISRIEFESEARACLKSEDVHLHNSLVLGILYNASSAVPGPSAARKGWSASGSLAAANPGHQPSIHQAEAEAYQHEQDGFNVEALELEGVCVYLEPETRSCLLAASLTTTERQRIKTTSKPLSRNMSAVANTSSWAGAGADLLERKRKEEEKKTRENERKRLKELHTEIGGKDWMKDVLAEEAVRQENRAALPAATAQALLRASKVPLCTESKLLPLVGCLADLMTAPAVEAGLYAGVSTDAADMLSAGLQAHVRNILSGMILAVRANRAAGGIRLQTSSNSCIESGERSTVSGHDSVAASQYQSPSCPSRLELPESPYDQAYSKVASIGPTQNSEHSSRDSTGSSSVSTAVSSLFSRTHRFNGIGADSSVTSLASTTAPTQAGSSSDAGSDVEMEDIAKAKGPNDSSDDSMPSDDFDADPRDGQAISAFTKSTTRGADDSGLVIEPLHSSRSTALPHRPSFRSSLNSHISEPPLSSLSLQDLAFFLRLEPHVLVESAGVGALERLLAPEADEKSLPLHQLEWAERNDLGEEERLALAVRHSAYSKEASEKGSDGIDDDDSAPLHRRAIAPLPALRASPATPSTSFSIPGRKSYLVKQQAPLALLLHRDVVTSKRKQSAASGGDSSTASKRSHVDHLSEVVDPVQLLAGYCS